MDIRKAQIVQAGPLSFCVLLDYLPHDHPDHYDPRDDIEKWCEENIEHTWVMRTIYISFRSPSDAVAFKLRWCN